MARERLDTHNPDVFQQAVISAHGKALRVVAPAGSGKTETLVRRVIERTGPGGIDPRRILMLTFDNNGQQSFSRMLKRFAPRQVLPKFQTFNKFGIGIIGSHFPEENGQIVRDAELMPFRRQIGRLPILEWDERTRDPIESFRAMKEQGYRPLETDRKEALRWMRTKYLELPLAGRAVDLFGGDVTESRAESTRDIDSQLNQFYDAYLLYEKEMRARGRMDYQDQKLRPLLRLVRNKKIVEQERQRYDEVIIDEAQDISRLDALLIWHVIGDNTTITLAGDDDQTIYEFKQASSVFLRDASKYFDREFETFQLNINYRSPEAILDPAQRLIAHNVERIEKTATSARSDLGDVLVRPASSDTARIQDIVTTLRELNARPGNAAVEWHEIGILTPSSKQQSAIVDALTKAKIPTKSNTGKNDTGVIENAVEMSTIHRAKGRQWRVVLLPMGGEGEMPTLQNVRQGNLEAERRAFYVSMSRAEDSLYFGYVRDGDLDTIARSATGEITGTSGASRFLFEAGLVQETNMVMLGDGIVTEVPASVATAEAADFDTATAPTPPSPAEITAGRASVAARLRQRGTEDLKRIGRVQDDLESTPTPEPGSPSATPITPPTEQIAPPPVPTTMESPVTERPIVAPVKVSPPPAPSAAPSSGPVASIATRSITPQLAAAGGSLTAEMRGLVDKAERQAQIGEYRFASACAWPVIEHVLTLVVGDKMGWSTKAVDRIDFLRDHQRVTFDTIRRLHAFRIARNEYQHGGGRLSEAERETATQAMVDDLRSFVALVTVGLATPESPRKPASTRTDRTNSTRSNAGIPPPGLSPAVAIAPALTPSSAPTPTHPMQVVPTAKVMQILGFLSRGGIDPDTRQPIRSITIHRTNGGIEFLPLQLGLVLYDIRFFIPESMRFTSMPIFAQYCQAAYGHGLPDAIVSCAARPIPDGIRGHEAEIHRALAEVLQAYADQIGERNLATLLHNRLADAIALGNGSVSRGIQLVPTGS